MLSKAPHVAMEAVAALPAATATLDVYGEFAAYHGDRQYGGVIDRAAAHPAITKSTARSLEHSKIAEVLSWLDVLVVPSTWNKNQPSGVSRGRAGRGIAGWRHPRDCPGSRERRARRAGRRRGIRVRPCALASDRSSLARLRAGLLVRSLDDAVAEMRALYVDQRERRAQTPRPRTKHPRPSDRSRPSSSITARRAKPPSPCARCAPGAPEPRRGRQQ